MHSVPASLATLHTWWWRLTWIAWALAPGSLLAMWALQRVAPEQFDPPILPLFALLGGHYLGLALAVAAWLVAGPHRRSAVLWCLTIYWLVLPLGLWSWFTPSQSAAQGTLRAACFYGLPAIGLVPLPLALIGTARRLRRGRAAPGCAA